MIARIQAESARLAREHKHSAVIDIHVLLAWLIAVEELEHPNKNIVRANLTSAVRTAIEDGKVGPAKGPSLNLSPEARSYLKQISTQYKNSDLFAQLLEKSGVSATSVVVNPPKAGTPAVEIAAELQAALDELDSMIGLAEVKKRMHELVQIQQVRLAQKAQGKKTNPTGLNLIFTGDPGTGKTTVARIVGKIYRTLGLLESGHVVEVSQSDLIAEYVGQTTKKTQDAIDSAVGGVLFIDEAYALAQKENGGYGQEAINTLVKAMDDKREVLAVIVAGYTEEMIPFIDANPGLKSRFSKQFYFENYTSGELFSIFAKTCSDYEIKINDEVDLAVRRHLDINPTSGANGNGRYVRNLFSMMYDHMAVRAAEDGIIEDHEMSEFHIDDVPFSLQKHERPGSVDDALAELDELVGLEGVKQKLKEIVHIQQARVVLEKANRPTPPPALNMVFLGPPGTGKTTVARIVARIFQSIGTLPQGQLVEVGREDLVAHYVGQTAPKVVARVKEAMGGVLFLDEAYSITNNSGGNDFGQEALAALITQIENQRGQFSFICAGYKSEMEQFLTANPGLKSRMDHVVEFTDYSAQELVDIFVALSRKQQIDVPSDTKTALKKHFESNETGGAAGNGRYARKLFDAVYTNMALRAAGVNFDLSALSSFLPTDVPKLLEKQKKTSQPIGFQAEN
jgi:SpoVK/Ycf46/Vps4 family AAA+-type ATPase